MPDTKKPLFFFTHICSYPYIHIPVAVLSHKVKAIGKEFDKTVPAIFTDEPQFMHKGTLRFAKEKKDVFLPWTDDLAETYTEVYEGEDLLAGLPELFWDYADGRVSVIRYHYHDAYASRIEAVFARGDRRLGPVIEDAVKRGARLDGWDEYFNYAKWYDAFRECGVDMEFYTTRGYGEEEVLAWDPIDVGVSKKFLLRERRQAYEAKITPDCREGCAGCGKGSGHFIRTTYFPFHAEG